MSTPQYIPDEERDKVINRLLTIPENKVSIWLILPMSHSLAFNNVYDTNCTMSVYILVRHLFGQFFPIEILTGLYHVSKRMFL